MCCSPLHTSRASALTASCPPVADFEKACSITGNNFNVYACLVCGKYFQGRGTHTQAYTHALQVPRAACQPPPPPERPLSAPAPRAQEGHHVFKNLHDGRVYCLPDGYEVVDQSLQVRQHGTRSATRCVGWSRHREEPTRRSPRRSTCARRRRRRRTLPPPHSTLPPRRPASRPRGAEKESLLYLLYMAVLWLYRTSRVCSSPPTTRRPSARSTPSPCTRVASTVSLVKSSESSKYMNMT